MLYVSLHPTLVCTLAEYVMVEDEWNRFRWYWLLEPEATAAFFLLGADIIVLLDIPFWVKAVCIPILGIACNRASRYRDRLQERLSSQWVDRPISWRMFWWSFAAIALLGAVFLFAT